MLFESTYFPDNSPSFFFIKLDKDGKLLYANKCFSEKFSVEDYGTTANAFKKCVVDEDEDLFYSTVAKVVETQQTVAVNLRKPSIVNMVVHMHWNFFPDKTDDTMVCGVGYDITPHITETQEHRNTLEKLNAILQTTDESFYLLDKNMIVMAFSRGAKIATKSYFNVELFPGLNFKKHLIEGTIDEFNDKFNRALHGETTHSQDKLIFPTGREVWFRLTMAPAYNSIGKIFGVTLSFVNSNVLKQSQQALDEIAWEQSHKVRGPLTNIISLTELLRLESGNNEKVLELIEASVLELDQIVRSIVNRAVTTRKGSKKSIAS